MPGQPTPSVSRADVARVVARDFPETKAAAVFAILDGYGAKNREREMDRVRLAALKLARGDIDRLRSAIDSARRDYRDVLASAEYPAYSQTPASARLSPAEQQTLFDADWAQYSDWLNA